MKKAKTNKELIITAEQNGFTMITNNITKNNKLSDGAIRLYCYLKSHNESFNLSAQSIANYLNKSDKTIRREINELKESGFLVLTRKENSNTYYYELKNSPKIETIKNLTIENILNAFIEGFISVKDIKSLYDKKIISLNDYSNIFDKILKLAKTEWIKKGEEE